MSQKEKKSMMSAKLIDLESSSHFQRLLGGPPETVSMWAGLVTLKAGESVGSHSTKDHEEFIVILKGSGKARIKGQRSHTIKEGKVLYIPPHTEHDIINTGREALSYVFVVSKITE